MIIFFNLQCFKKFQEMHPPFFLVKLQILGTPYFPGSLGTSVFDMDAFLVGSSGGVYALLAAHLANVLLVRTVV